MSNTDLGAKICMFFMNYALLNQPVYQAFRSKVRAFVDTHIVPEALDWENSQTFPHYLLAEFAAAGLIGLSLPLDIGGQGKDLWHEVILAEELGRAKTFGYPASVLVHTNMVLPLLASLAVGQQKEQFLTPAVRGEHYLALAITEPHSGSDVAAIQTQAVSNGFSYRVSGEKKYISNGSVANTIVTLVRSDSTTERDTSMAFDLLLMPAKLKGLTKVRLSTNGLNTGDMGHIIFDQCDVPQENLLGKTGFGFYYITKFVQRERLIGSAYGVALGQFVLTETIEFLKNRERFGSPLSRKQAIRHKVAGLHAKLFAAQQATYAVTDSYSRGDNVEADIMALKLFVGETVQEVLRECVQLHGAEGFVRSHWLSHVYRDSQTFSILGGTSEIMRDILAGMIKM